MKRHSVTATILSILFMGLGQIYNRQRAKGALFALAWAAAIYGTAVFLFEKVKGLITLGDTPTGLVKVGRIYKTVQGDHSIFMMIEGLIALFVILLFIGIYILNVRDAYRNGERLERGERPDSFLGTVGSLGGKYFPYFVLVLPAVSILFLTVLPIIFSILLAFTNFAEPNLPPGNLIDWVGFANFFRLVQLKTWSATFMGVLSWTIIWAVIATVTTYFGGMLVAVLIHQPGIRFKKLWRVILIIPFAIPNLVSLLVMRNLFNNKFGPINEYLELFGIRGIPWLTDPVWAKVTVILVNMWIGIPVSMILISGILTTIPSDLYEAAEVDGATPRQKFWNITMPLVLFSTAPILIMQFAGNINNFNVIFLLTGGDPVNPNYQYAGSTDLLVTWLYKLTLNNQQYNLSSVIGIIIFILIASLSIYNYRRTRSYREEDMVA
ncbi:carbohydrate ABC transporter permease [Paenibacillus tarimensis]